MLGHETVYSDSNVATVTIVQSYSVILEDPIGEDGTLEKQESTYDGKEKCFIVSHFSDYVIVYTAPENDRCNIFWIILIILIIVIIIAVTAYVIYKRRKPR